MTVAIGYGIYTEYKPSSALGFWFTQRGKIRKEKGNIYPKGKIRKEKNNSI